MTAVRKRWLVLGGLLLFYSWFVHFWPTFHAANESIRLYFVSSVVDHGTPAVDEVLERYGGRNVDRAEFEGHSYLDKAPGLSFAVMPLYWVLTRLGMSTEFVDLPALYHLLLIFGVAIPAVLGVYWVHGIVLEQTEGDDRAAWTAALVLGLATPYALYATLFFGHTPAAVLGIGSLYYLRRDMFVTAGALAGAMVLVDTATCVLATILGLYAGIKTRRLECMIRFGLGGIPFVGAQLAYNTWLFGEPFRFAYSYKAAADLAAIHEQGFMGFRLPSAEALVGLSVGPMRGLFYHAPVLLIGLLAFRRARFLAVAVGVYFLWIACFVDWPAGASYGPRHLVVLAPLLAVGVGLALHGDPRLRWVVPGLAVASFAATWAMIATFPYAPGGFDAPLVQLGFPMVAERHFSPTLFGLPALASLLVIGGIVAVLKPSRRTLLAGLAGVVLIAAAVLARPEDSRMSLGSRCFVECLTEHPETGKALCEEASGRWVERACVCRLPR